MRIEHTTKRNMSAGLITKVYEPIGRCIFCGAEHPKGKLAKEHIFPLGLSGHLLFRHATCKPCEITIDKFENFVLHKTFGIARVRIGTASRNKKGRPTLFTCKLLNQYGTLSEVSLPIEDFPSFSMVVSARGPEILDGNPNANGLTVVQKVIRTFNASKYAGIGLVQEWRAGALELMLAKIAHSYAIAIAAIQADFDPLLPAVILGENPNIWSYVGRSHVSGSGFKGDAVCEGHFNQIRLEHKSVGSDEFLCAYVQIFAPLEMPVYEVVVARRARDTN